MKRLFKLLLAVMLVMCLSITTVYAGGVEDGDIPIEDTLQSWIDGGYPVVTNIFDSSKANYAKLCTDQMGDYVSVFVQGYNIDMSTVKPVFYDDEGNVISGNVVAVETITSGYGQGAYFRIEKLESDAWNIENTSSMDTKQFKVKLEAVSDKEIKYEYGTPTETVKLYRRDVFYTSFDNIRETFTVYFSTDVKPDTNVMPALALGYHTYDSETGTYPFNIVKEAQAVKMTREVNKFTGHEETKAVFSLEGFDYNNAFDNWSPQFAVTFKNSITGENETYDLYDDMDINQCVGRTSFFPETYEKTYVKGNRDVILYYPYWIGGVYQFADTGDQHFITKEEAKYLGNERFAYADYTKGGGSLSNGNFKSREYSFAFYISDAPEKPSGVPVVSVEQKSEEEFVLSWNKIKGATGYRIYAVAGEDKLLLEETESLTYTLNKYILDELGYMLNGDVELKICAYSEKNGVAVDGDLSAPISFEPKVAPSLNATKKSLDAGKTFELKVANAEGLKVTYKSKKTSVATVNKKTGVVTALKKGTAKIIATVDGTTLSCTIKVKTTPQVKYNNKVAKNNKTISVKKGNSVKLTITGKASAINNKVTTSKKAVAKITSKAKNPYVTIKGMKKGVSTVTVKINNSVTYQYKIKVN